MNDERRIAAQARSYGGLDQEERRADRLHRMLEAGLELFGTKGFHSVSIAEICQRARISRSAFYDQVATQENLLMAVVSAIDARAIDRISEALAAHTSEPFTSRTRHALRAYLSVTCADIYSARVCYVEIVGVSPTIEEWRTQRREAFVALIVHEARAAVARGELPDRDYRHSALAAIGVINALAYEWVNTQQTQNALSFDQMAAEVTHVVVATALTPVELPDHPTPTEVDDRACG
ncbi:TetR/AcrR family transcriptional regulator [Nocardia sp. NPDC088792]|uniref:TetR/AcrR family transcriptional regulator n=1 Tax=Nocardia sp. NPDC088792 TaxID=3364332 RepID=UPI0038091482